MKKIRVFLSICLMLCLVGIVPPAGAEAEYSIDVDITNQIVTVYRESDGVIVRQMVCSSGVDKHPSPTGTYYMPTKQKARERTEWYAFEDGFGKFGSRIWGNFLFHSYLFDYENMNSVDWDAVASLGTQSSHGCIRLTIADAKWISENCLPGTPVKLSKSGEDYRYVRELLIYQSYTIDDGISYAEFCSVAEQEGDLGYGSQGEAVVALQTRLTELGLYADETDGVYDEYMVKLVRILKTTMGMTKNGIADAAFLAALDEDGAPTSVLGTFSVGSSGAGVSLLQVSLKKLGFLEGEITGQFDAATENAVKIYQRLSGEEQTGIATSQVQAGINDAVEYLNDKYGEGMYALVITETDVQMATVPGTSRLNIRSKTSTSSTILDYAMPGAELIVVDKGDQWTKVRSENATGYVMSQYLSFFVKAEKKYAYQAADDAHPAIRVEDVDFAGRVLGTTVVTYGVSNLTYRLNVRVEKNQKATIAFKIPNNITFQVLSDDGTWSQVFYGGKTGYALSKYIETMTVVEIAEPAAEPMPGVTAYARIIKFKNPYIYSEASEDAVPLGEMQPSTEIGIISVGESAIQVNYRGIVGYVSKSAVTFEKLRDVEEPLPIEDASTAMPAEDAPLPTLPPMPTAAPTHVPEEDAYLTVTVNTGTTALLNLRAEPSSSGQVLDTLENGTEMELIEDLGEWAYIRVDGVYGYVMTNFIE